MGHIGMQRWIYTQKPRQFFSKDRANPGNNFDIGTDSSTKVAGRASSAKDARQRVDRYFEQRRRARAVGLVALLGIALLLGWLAHVYYSSPAPIPGQKKYLEARHREALREQAVSEQEYAYLLLIESGDLYFQNRQFMRAIEEYSQAAYLLPNARAPLPRIARSYQCLCDYYGDFCTEAKRYAEWVE